jgi:hypothetical protein
MQRKLGNIVDVNENNKYDPMFNRVSSYSDIIEGIPTLIIGMDSAKEILPDFSILNRLNGDVWWTFSKKERRSDNVEDIRKFKEKVLKMYLSKVKYEYVNFTCYPIDKIKKFIRYMKGGDKKLCLLTKDSRFIFIYSEKYNTVWGLSLSLCDYIGICRKKVAKKIRENKNNIFMNGISFADGDIRKIIGDDTHLILPALSYFGEK